MFVMPGFNDFEDGLYSWTNDQSPDDDFDWIIGSGGTPSYGTGPSMDHTLGTDSGKIFHSYI